MAPTKKRKKAAKRAKHPFELELAYKGLLITIGGALAVMLLVYAIEIFTFRLDEGPTAGTWPAEGTPALTASIGNAFPSGTLPSSQRGE